MPRLFHRMSVEEPMLSVCSWEQARRPLEPHAADVGTAQGTVVVAEGGDEPDEPEMSHEVAWAPQLLDMQSA